MTDPKFGYRAILKSDDSGVVTSLVAYLIEVSRPLQAVLWSVPRMTWIYAPGLAARFIYDDQFRDRIRPLDRAAAELTAREVLGAELPTEDALLAMCAEGERMGWEFGPPRP